MYQGELKRPEVRGLPEGSAKDKGSDASRQRVVRKKKLILNDQKLAEENAKKPQPIPQ